MKIPKSWLNDYVKFNSSIEDISHSLTMAGNEVENIKKIGYLKDVVVGEINDIRSHPNADNLQLVSVDNGSTIKEVVCGAENIYVGQKIAFAFIGAELFNPYENELKEKFTLKPSKIRGVISEGMICSEKELGIGNDHSGILNLDSKIEVGTAISEVIGDSILELSLTPNRPDCLGVLGIAREISAITKSKLILPKVDYISNDINVNSLVSVEIQSDDLCERYLGAVIKGVKIQSSPNWLQNRLIAIGERPINNIVDVTNYVMFEIGQPLHAFDYSTISGKKILVRTAKKNEKIITLDNQNRELNSTMLVISDPQKIIGIAGVMGGKNSEITDETTAIFLESATFNSSNIRKTSKSLNLTSQATLRFEKGLKPGLAEFAIKRAINMILDIAGGECSKGFIDEFSNNFSEEKYARPIFLDRNFACKILGFNTEDKIISETFERLGFNINLSKNGWNVYVPFWRTDLNIPEDLIEEIARIVGYDNFPSTTISDQLPVWRPTLDLDLKRNITDYLVEFGMQEIISYSATNIQSEKRLEFIDNFPPPIKISNPISNEFNILRRTLRESILNCVSKNSHTWKHPISVFEIGRVFFETNEDLPQEKTMLNGAFAGQRFDLHWDFDENKKFDYFDAKGAVEYIMEKLRIEVKFKIFNESTFIDGRCAKIFSGENFKMEIGILGQIDPKILSMFDSHFQEVYLFEIDIDVLLKIYSINKNFDFYTPFSKHQNSYRDISIIVNDFEEVENVLEIVRKEKLVSNVHLTDIYRGEDIKKDKKVITIRIEYQSSQKTLKSTQISKIEGKILFNLNKSLGAELRS
ncbi:MAG: phenylalanine--tRNA ligase subunit beta [Chloroflexi bacterium]|nr:phenylalanine--tRNA ligase subunit beta [Chloroflexota bacterium]|tara:strand:- start:6874 stop:9309 length:2436 start_codon:yes stop_codon:yes gene_type:complete